MDYKSIDFENEAQIEALIEDCGYVIRKTEHDEGREAETLPLEDLHLSQECVDFVRERRGIENLWKHQHLAIKAVMEGKNVCVTTSTSSGKTEIFQLACMEILHNDPSAKVLAVYPMKALNRQQLDRWYKTGLKVGRIDGDVAIDQRPNVLNNSQVVVMTPDTIHSYLLANLNSKKCGAAIKDFIAHIAVVVIDELHLYKGYFGTNCAYLFRRLSNVRRLLRKDTSYPQYITASATLPSATEHSFNITGANDFVEIGEDVDGSLMSKKTTYFIEKAEEGETGNVATIVKAFAEVRDTKSITFVEGRQRTGDLATSASADSEKIISDCEKSGIYPFRAGYDKETVDKITDKMRDAEFRGIISTSALEIGIDIEGVNVVILADMPQDINSYRQRIGRAGRFGCEKSYVIVVKNDSLASKLLFEHYEFDVAKVLPSYEPSLYLEDKNVQNIHALLHVGDHDECECPTIATMRANNIGKRFDGNGYFPSSFITICNEVVTGNTSAEYESLTMISPHREYQPRFFGKQYKIIPTASASDRLPSEESIGREQIATEGYRYALRNTLKGGERVKEEVVGFNSKTREITVAMPKDRFARTQSYHRPCLVPNFRDEFRNGTLTYGEAMIFNLRTVEQHYIYGYYHIKNGKKTYNRYDVPMRMPPLKTTGTLFFHPSFNEIGVKTSDIADILSLTFLQRNAFDRNDIKHLGGKLYTGYNALKENSKFVAIYDTTPLNLTGRIMEATNLRDLFAYLDENEDAIIDMVCPDGLNGPTRQALDDLCADILNNTADATAIEMTQQRIFKSPTPIVYLGNIVAETEEEHDAAEGEDAMFIKYDSEDRSTATIVLKASFTQKEGILINEIRPTEATQYEVVKC